MANLDISGTFTALVTPFTQDGASVNFDALERLVTRQIEGGVSGLVPCGTTGETPTMTASEQIEIIRLVARVAKGKVPIIAGAGSNSTAKSIEASKAAVLAGADAVMIVMPYYNKPSQEGMRAHVVAVAREVDCPIVVYNIPGRSVVDLGLEATEAICREAPNVVALKDATGNVLRCQELKRRLGDRLTVMCGDDALTLAMMAAGASGVISVTSNILPAQVSEVTGLVKKGDLAAARAAHYRLLPIHGLMFVESSPGPVKAAGALLGHWDAGVRLPLIAASQATTDRIDAALNELGVVTG